MEIVDNLEVSDSSESASIEEYIEKNPIKIVLGIILTILSSSIGFFYGGYIGILIGLGIGFSAFLLGPKKIKEKRIK